MKRISTVFSAAIAGACLAHLATDVHTQGMSCQVTTGNGAIQGLDRGASCAFLGIPYAAPPLGAQRWRPPQPASPWTLLNATAPPPNCPTVQMPAGTPAGNEDCLKLNIWVSNPPPSQPAPVVVWLHTGAFFGASANFAGHNGQRLVEETGVIVVSPNYRLGPLGFLAHDALASEDPAHPSSGNYGLLDQRAALVWVRDNIDRFGGDPDRVTIAGTSAGGDSVGLHLVSPGSGGLFHRAIVQSGYPTVRWPFHAEASLQGKAFSDALGCTDIAQVLPCMRSRSRDQVLLALAQATQQVAEPPGKVYWQPVVDGLEIPDQPRDLVEAGAFHRVPTIIGTNRDEGAGSFITRSFPAGVSVEQYEGWLATEFGASAPLVLAAYPPEGFASPGDAMARVLGDGQFVCEARRLGRMIAETETRTFVYSYEHEIDDLFLDRVIHGVEGNIIFGNHYVPPLFASHTLDAADQSLHAAMAGYWARFAASGTPNIDDDEVVRWPAFKDPQGEGRGSNKHIVFGTPISSDKRLREGLCNFWDPFFFRTMLGGSPAAQP
jgi:para-nitrobenzyl esterase